MANTPMTQATRQELMASDGYQALNPYGYSLPTDDIAHHATVIDGVVRWKSNGRVPPGECLQKLALEGVEFDPSLTLAAHDAEVRTTLGRYSAAQAARTPEQIAEDNAEIRAAFGPGVTVVDVITGKKVGA